METDFKKNYQKFCHQKIRRWKIRRWKIRRRQFRRNKARVRLIVIESLSKRMKHCMNK